jgi:thiazole synthase ThiGH ThiG subunit
MPMLVSINDEAVEVDTVELVRAAEQLPLGALIGIGLGIANPRHIEMIVEQANSAGASQKLRVCGRGGEWT